MIDHPCFKCRNPTKAEANAFKKLYEGTAQAHQQQAALKFLVDSLCRPHDVLYIPGDPETTAFINGRAWVGQKILKYIKVPIGKLALQEDPQQQEAGTND